MVRTSRIDLGSPTWVSRSLAVLRAGGLVAFPTDTVYGVGAILGDSAAVESIREAKGRPSEKPIPVLVSSWDNVPGLAETTSRTRRLAAAFWPGPLTLILRSHPGLPSAVESGGTVGIRAPDHPAALALLREAGPLAVTSANRSGNPDPVTADDVMAALGGRIDLVVDGGACPGGRPSTVVDCTGGDPKILRQGPVGLEAILAVWRVEP